MSAPGYASYLSTVTIADDHNLGVRVTESNGSTNVIEYQNRDFGLGAGTALADGLPFEDSYTIALTQAPAAGETIRITVGAPGHPHERDGRDRLLLAAAPGVPADHEPELLVDDDGTAITSSS